MWSNRSHALGSDCLPGWQAAQGLRLQRTAACRKAPVVHWTPLFFTSSYCFQ
jgi:hypothetical protein